jgi:hypothetical protein
MPRNITVNLQRVNTKPTFLEPNRGHTPKAPRFREHEGRVENKTDHQKTIQTATSAQVVDFTIKQPHIDSHSHV